MERKKKEKKERDENKEKNRRKEKRIPDQRSKGSKKGKEVILDQWKKENGRSSDQINFRQGKWLPAKENPFFVSPPFRLPFKVVLDWRYPHPTWTKRKRPKHPASSPKTPPSRKSYWSVIVRLIFDLIGNHVQNRVMVQLWFGNRIKHLPVWVLYTMSDFFSA